MCKLACEPKLERTLKRSQCATLDVTLYNRKLHSAVVRIPLEFKSETDKVSCTVDFFSNTQVMYYMYFCRISNLQMVRMVLMLNIRFPCRRAFATYVRITQSQKRIFPFRCKNDYDYVISKMHSSGK